MSLSSSISSNLDDESSYTRKYIDYIGSAEKFIYAIKQKIKSHGKSKNSIWEKIADRLEVMYWFEVENLAYRYIVGVTSEEEIIAGFEKWHSLLTLTANKLFENIILSYNRNMLLDGVDVFDLIKGFYRQKIKDSDE